MSIERLIHAADRTAQAAEDAGARFAAALAAVLKETERRLPRLLRAVTEGNRTAIVKAAQANQVRTELRDALRDGGFDALIDVATSAPFDRMATRVLAGRRLAQASAALTQGVEIRLAALKALAAVDLLDEGDQTARALWQATIRGVFGSRSVDAILTDLGTVLDDTAPHLQTFYDTSLSIYGRQVEALQAGDAGDATFLYLGPADIKTRDFCRARVGKVFTRDAIDAMDNGQLDNVFLTGGGYNCRHTFIEVSKYSELQDLGGERLPEVQMQLDEAA